MQIDAHKRPMEDILKIGQHVIPRYQRRYAWEEQNIRDYWADITASSDAHFLGSMVVSGKSSSPREVIDGQQRLTTTIIALSALREIYEEIGATTRVTGINAYIEYDNRDGDREYRLTNKDEKAQSRLSDNALLPLTKRSAQLELDASSRENQAFALFSTLIREEITPGSDPVARLDRIRDAILETEVVYINVEDRRNAFTIFETLNDRGQSLTVMDLVKNLLFSKIPESAADDIERAWSESLELIYGCSFEGMAPDYFLYYFWNSRSLIGQASTETIEQSRLRRSISDHLEHASDAEAAARRVVSDIHAAANTMVGLDSTLTSTGLPDGWRSLDPKWRRDKYEDISRKLYGILVTGANQPFPALLSLMKAYHRSTAAINTKTLLAYLSAIENFQFRWTIAQKPSTSTIRRLYRHAATSIDAATTAPEFKKSLDEFCSSSAKIGASDNQFKEGIGRLTYSQTRAKDLHKIRYLLTRIESHMGNTKLDLSRQMSIEHLQGLAGRSEATPRNFWIFKVGNLALLSPSINSSLPPQFADKCKTLKNWVNPGDQALMEAIDKKIWSNTDFGKRHEQILQLALEIWPGSA